MRNYKTYKLKSGYKLVVPHFLQLDDVISDLGEETALFYINGYLRNVFMQTASRRLTTARVRPPKGAYLITDDDAATWRPQIRNQSKGTKALSLLAAIKDGKITVDQLRDLAEPLLHEDGKAPAQSLHAMS